MKHIVWRTEIFILIPVVFSLVQDPMWNKVWGRSMCEMKQKKLRYSWGFPTFFLNVKDGEKTKASLWKTKITSAHNISTSVGTCAVSRWLFLITILPPRQWIMTMTRFDLSKTVVKQNFVQARKGASTMWVWALKSLLLGKCFVKLMMSFLGDFLAF